MTRPPGEPSQHEAREVALAAIVAALLLLLLAWVLASIAREVPPEDEPFITEYVFDEPEPRDDATDDAQAADETAAIQDQTSPPSTEQPTPARPTPEEEPELVPDEQPVIVPPPDNARRQSVDQPTTNQEVPQTDDYYLAEVDNTTDVETVAENATSEDQEEAPVDTQAFDSESMDAAQQPSPTRTDSAEAAADPNQSDERPSERDDATDQAARGEEAAVPEENRRLEAAASDEQRAPQALGDGRQPQDATSPFERSESGQVQVQPGASQAEAYARATGLGAQMEREAQRAESGRGRDSITRQGLAHARANLDEIFGETDEEALARGQQQRRRDSLFGDHAGDWQRTRQAMENYDVAVTTGSETRLNTRRDEHASFINAFHRRIHDEWWAVLQLLSSRYGPSENISNRDLTVRLEIRVLADGKVDRIRIVNTSGNTFFDAEAIRVNYDVRRTSAPPANILCDDGSVYLHWTFSRMPGRCGTHGASVHCPAG